MPAYLFENEDALVAALTLCDDAASWRQPARLTRLEAADGQVAWLIETPQSVAGVPAAGYQLETSEGRLTVVAPADRRDYVRQAARAYPSLLQAVPLQPASSPSRPPLLYVEAASHEAFVDAARANLMLGCDRLRYLPLEDGRMLLWIEDQSAFLTLRQVADPALSLYLPALDEPRLLVPLGWRYPLSAKFRFQPGGELDRWLVSRDGPWRHVRGELRDIYERVRVDPGGLSAAPAATPMPPPPVTVALRLEPDETVYRPQLWWLAAAERPRLLELLREAGEAELGALLVGVFALPDGETITVLLERTRGPGSLRPPIRAGRAYYARMPDEHLYLPLGVRLAPSLARRTMVEACGLADSHLTVLEPSNGEALRLWRFPRAALVPLPQIVTYLAGEAAPAVEDLLARVSVELDLTVAEEEPPPAAAPVARPARGFWARLFGRGQPRSQASRSRR